MSNTAPYAESHPELAALAAYVREQLGGDYNAVNFPIHAFLQTNLPNCPPPLDPGRLPPARHFDTMGQVLMRSGSGPDDTYCLFACGGILGQHRHFDATHFTIYHRGFLALDTGTRTGNTDNLQNYYAQTVAHNCIQIKMPGEPPIPYWNGTARTIGQYKRLARGHRLSRPARSSPMSRRCHRGLPAAKCSQMVRRWSSSHHTFRRSRPRGIHRRDIHEAPAAASRQRAHRNEHLALRPRTAPDLLPHVAAADAEIEPVGARARSFSPMCQLSHRRRPFGADGSQCRPEPIHYDEVPTDGRWRAEVSRAQPAPRLFLT